MNNKKMSERSQQIDTLLRREVAYKSAPSAVSFIIFATFIFFYGFETKVFLLPIRILSALVIVISIFRLKVSKRVKLNATIQKRDWRNLTLLVLANTLIWSVIMALASYELRFEGVAFVILNTAISGFIAASLVTLSYNVPLFVTFQMGLLLPQSCIILYFYHLTGDAKNLPLVPLFIVYFIYQMRQLSVFRSQIIERYNYELDLIESKEALINQTTKLVHTSRLAALGEMSAGIAHEVNNPLAIISGSLQHLEKILHREPIDKERLLKLTHRSQHSIERITKIIYGLRHFSQQSDSLPMAQTPIREIIEETFNFCSEMLSARYISLWVEEIPNAKIDCHPVQISQVLINLIKNAEDALSTEPEQETRWIELKFETSDNGLLIHICNGGPGIPEEIHTKLFEPFFTTKGVGKGTGLGLSISRGIMKEHGGDLVYSPIDNLTRFTMILPAIYE